MLTGLSIVRQLIGNNFSYVKDLDFSYNIVKNESIFEVRHTKRTGCCNLFRIFGKGLFRTERIYPLTPHPFHPHPPPACATAEGEFVISIHLH